jgi:hypothetical protein
MTDLTTITATTLDEIAKAICELGFRRNVGEQCWPELKPEHDTLIDLLRQHFARLKDNDHPGMAALLILDAMIAMHMHDLRLASAFQPPFGRRRESLPDRRASENFQFNIWDDKTWFYCTRSHFADSRLAEIFLDYNKAGTQLGALVRDAAIMASLAFQFGCSCETACHAVTREEDGSASSPLGKALDLITKGDSK